MKKLFESDRMPLLPKNLIKDEYGARQNFLSCLNVTLAAEALARQCPSENPFSQGLFAMLKLTLQPLWSSFLMFSRRKLQLRRSALRLCWNDQALVIKLMASNPLTEDLFDMAVVKDVTTQAERQAKSVLTVLGNYPQGIKRGAPQQLPRTPKRQKPGSSYRQDYQGSTHRSSAQRRDDQGQDFKRKGKSSSPSKRLPRTPKRGQKSPRGRTPRSQNTPRRNQPGQGNEGSF